MSARQSLAHVFSTPIDDDPPSPAPPFPIPDSTLTALLPRARALITRHLAEPPALIDALILWALHTHAHARFAVSPRLILHGRDPRADHARALRLLRWLTPSARLVARASATHVLELIAHENPTLLFDDAANAILPRRDMRALIAAGAHADGALLGRRTRRKESAFRRCAAPLAIATATNPPQEVLGHAIVLPMEPPLRAEGRARDPIAEPPAEALALRAEFEALGARLKAANTPPAPALPVFLSAVAAETWTPLFVCAEALGGDADAAARAAASQFAVCEHLVRPTSPLALLRDIRRVFGVEDQPVPSKHVVEQLTRDADSPWGACDGGGPLTPRGVAQRLAVFDLKPHVIHIPHGPSFRGYRAGALVNAFARYLADPVAIVVQRDIKEGERFERIQNGF